MADPRDDVRLEFADGPRFTLKIDDSTITYESTKENGTSHDGKAVTLSDDNTAALAGDGEGVIGRLVEVSEDDKCVVEKGFVELPGGNGASLTNNKAIVGDLDGSGNKGYIREVNTATAAELGVMQGQIFDNSTTTAVVVYLP